MKLAGGAQKILRRAPERDISAVGRILEEPTEAERQLEVWRETGSTVEV